MHRDTLGNMQSRTVVLAALKLPIPFISQLVTDKANIEVNICDRTYESGFLIYTT